MEDTLLSLVINVASERKEACEWLSITTQVEEQKYRQFSADLERRRRRKYNSHLEEQKKVEKELNDLQKDRQRFEREKQLRRRKSLSAYKVKKTSSKTQEKKEEFHFLGGAMGGSASIAFDPKIEKTRRRRRKSKTEKFNTAVKNKEHVTDDESFTNFPYLSEKEVIKFHQSCKSAALRGDCRRWGAAWLYAKKEQDATPNKNQRWKTLLLNAEKEKMRSLCDKLTSLTTDRIIKNCWIGRKMPEKDKKVVGTKAKKSTANERQFQRENTEVFTKHCENIKAAMNGCKQTNNKELVKATNTWATKQIIKSPKITVKSSNYQRLVNLQAIDEVHSSTRTSMSIENINKAFLPDL